MGFFFLVQTVEEIKHVHKTEKINIYRLLRQEIDLKCYYSSQQNMMKDTLAYTEQRGWRGNLRGRKKDLTVCFPKNNRIRKICLGNFFIMSNLIQLLNYLCSVFLVNNCYKLPRPVYVLYLE